MADFALVVIAHIYDDRVFLVSQFIEGSCRKMHSFIGDIKAFIIKAICYYLLTDFDLQFVEGLTIIFYGDIESDAI